MKKSIEIKVSTKPIKKILNICFREVKAGTFKGSIDCVLLDFPAGVHNQNIECYAHIGQHSVGEYDYFINSTKAAVNYSELLNEIKSVYGPEYLAVVHKRMTRKYLKRK